MNRACLTPGRLAACLLLSLAACDAAEDPFAVATDDSGTRALATHFSLPDEARERVVIETAEAAPATLARTLNLPARVRFNEDHRATITTQLGGVVVEVLGTLGEEVQQGQTLAVLHSRELARLRSSYVEAIHVLEFALIAFEREERLWNKRITAEEIYLRARHDVEEARLMLRTTQQELQALGLGTEELDQAHKDHGSDEVEPADMVLNRFERWSPIDGVIVSRSIVLGDAVHGEAVLFEVADMDTVWVDIKVRAADLGGLSVGSPVEVASHDLGRSVTAEVAYLDARVDPATQTALARVVLPNTDGAWRPGLYVTVSARVGHHDADVAVPAASVHRFAGPTAETTLARVFVAAGAGRWEVREVRLGVVDGSLIEVLDGLQPGEVVAVTEGLLLKSVWLGHGASGE